MDTWIYIGTAVLAVAWTVWVYLAWADKAKLPEDSSWRFALIIAPSAYFLVIALAGWARALFIRLDLIGIVIYDGLIVLTWLILLLGQIGKRKKYKKIYSTIMILYNILALLLVGGVHLVRLFPPLIIRLTNLIGQLMDFDLFGFAWIGLDPETHEQDLPAMVNKIVIALLSYVPISIVRALYVNRQMNRQQHRTDDKISKLKKRIDELEKTLSSK